MKTHFKIAAAAMLLPALLVTTPVMAANEGQTEGGDIYRVKNVTKNTQFADPVNADKCEKLTYKVRIHNPGPGVLAGVNVKANLSNAKATSNTSTITVTSANADPASTSDNAVVALSSAQSINYVSGTTKLLDHNGNVIKQLPDGITQGGVNIGNVGVSLQQKRFVQFDAQVDCPTTTTEQPKPGTPVVPSAEQPATLPETGPEAGLAAMAGSGILGYAVMAYRRSKRALAAKLLNR